MSTLLADFQVGEKVLTAEYRHITADYGRVLDSIEFYGRSRITQNEYERDKPVDPKILGVPDVWRIVPLENKNYLSTPMDKEFQFWIYRINVERMFRRRLTDVEFEIYYKDELRAYKLKDPVRGQTIRDFNSLFRSKGSHTNFAGVNVYGNFIADENIGTGLPMFSNIVTGRWVCKLREPYEDVFEVINASKPYTHYHPETHPHLFDEPLSTGRVLSGNVIVRDDVRNKYNDFGERVVMPVILPRSGYARIENGGLMMPGDTFPLNKFGAL